jgi:DNA-binding response OmpR family regulator
VPDIHRATSTSSAQTLHPSAYHRLSGNRYTIRGWRGQPASRAPRFFNPTGVAQPTDRPASQALAFQIQIMNDFPRAPRILVVEDDDDIAQALQRSLRMEGYEVRTAGDGADGLEQAHTFAPDLVILDLGLPKVDGIDVARSLRERDDLPILILTARDAVESRVEGLDAGADDYLVKPFERQELLARLRALLRRRPPRGSAPLRVGDLSLNVDTHEVFRAARAIDLTQREFELLEYLMRNERIVISRQRLLDEVWGYDPFSTTNTIEVFVSNLRRKLEAEGEPRLLHTIRGAGYVLRA